jgi:hypothetical protein
VIDSDRVTFARAFQRVCGAFRLRFKANEAEDLTTTYFKILEPYPLDRVLLAGKQCMTVSRKFPLAADWVAAVVDLSDRTPSDVRQMTIDELDEHEAAERARWEDAPCSCVACVRANVGQSPLRFVPTHATFSEDERAFNPRRQAVQIVGHWAHGEELGRWYDARARFYASAPKRFRRVLALVGATREPGMEG